MTELDFGVVLADLTTLLAPQEVDTQRAILLVDLAVERVSAIVSPVPAEARPIVLDVVRRAYENPGGVQSEQVGPFTRTFRSGGVYLLEQERVDLQALAARTDPRAAAAFTIRPAGSPPTRCWW